MDWLCSVANAIQGCHAMQSLGSEAIERRLQEEDPELAEFDDMDEDMEREVSPPETYKR